LVDRKAAVTTDKILLTVFKSNFSQNTS